MKKKKRDNKERKLYKEQINSRRLEEWN